MEMDKRKSTRFLVTDDVVVVLRDKRSKIGRVRDIGMGGLSFEHVHGENSNLESSKRDISLWVNDFSVSHIPCKVVYDIPIGTPPEHDFLTIRHKTRRCGIQFEALLENQKAQLDLFLKTYIQGRA